jgi:tRNA (mo5U34)-methyltransferase
MDASTPRARIDSNPLWYHTMDLHGVVTDGWFDLRSVVGRLPWPDVAGKRCLDVGTFDGFLAFELERRGAAEVVCTDVPSHADWDHLPLERANALAFWDEHGGEKGAGFAIAKDVLGSSVQREWVNIYELSPERLGTFDVVVCGTLLLHLRRPFDAIEAVASVCRGEFLSCEQIDPLLTITHLVVGLEPAGLAEGGVVGVATTDHREVLGAEGGQDQHRDHGHADRADDHRVALAERLAHPRSHLSDPVE